MSDSGPYDVIVVGAGFTGALVAFHLAEEGLTVAVLEATSKTGGTVSRQPGLITLGTPETFSQLEARWGTEVTREIWDLTHENLQRMAALVERTGATAIPSGDLRLAGEDETTDSLEETAGQLQQYGYAVKLEATTPYGARPALRTSGSFVCLPGELTAALLDHEKITLEFDAEVQQLKPRPEGGVAVWAHKHYLWADQVVIANGFHATRLSGALGKVLQPVHVHTIKLENTRDYDRPCISNQDQACMVPYEDHIYLSGWGAGNQPIVARLSKIVRAYLPDARVVERHAHWVMSGVDAIPVVGQLPDLEGVTVINGLGPFGLNLVTVAVDVLVKQILNQHPAELFNLQRFDP
jgi:glycine/D-amino acid oxidase-like deaminating enzyme